MHNADFPIVLPVRSRPLAVDARALHAAGIGRYLREVLSRVLVDERFPHVVLLGGEDECREFALQWTVESRFSVLRLPHGFYSPRAQLAWASPRLRRRLARHAAFFPHFDAPVLGMPARSAVTIQDLIHFKVPELFSLPRRLAGGVVLERVVRGAKTLFVSSEATRRDLIERVPESEPKIKTIPLGVSPFFTPSAVMSDTVGSLRPFLLCIGNRKPHKNLATAVEALAELRQDCSNLRLVIAGKIFPGWDAVMNRADSLGVAGAIVERAAPSDDELRDLYRGCEALLFPSLYEGFGLPILEAMACGAPVVASDRSSMPEVVGDAGLLVNPTARGGFADAVRSLRADPVLRSRLVARGRERARRFSWSVTARRTADALYGLISS